MYAKHSTPAPPTPAELRNVAQRNVERFRKFLADYVAAVDRKHAEAEARIARYRAGQSESDVIVCPRCLAVQTDEARCLNCGRHSEP